MGKPVHVLNSLTALLSPFGRQSTKLGTVVANTIEIETVTAFIFLHLSQHHAHDDRALNVFGDMASMSWSLVGVLTGHWERLQRHSSPYAAITVEGGVLTQQKALLQDLKRILQYVSTRPVVLHDAIMLGFQVDEWQQQLAEDMLQSEGILTAMSADSDPVSFFKSPTYTTGLSTLAQQEGLERVQVLDDLEFSGAREIPECLVAAAHT